jgi:predicted DNA-binding mobile mystery protein A
MKLAFQKMMRNQVQADLNDLAGLVKKPIPRLGWMRLIRQALGMASRQLAKRLECSPSNIRALERREKNGSITLESLNRAAQAMNCRCVYFFVPNKPFDQLLEDQAHAIAKKHLSTVGHSMELEMQGLSAQQKEQQENDLAQELLRGNPKELWADDDEI